VTLPIAVLDACVLYSAALRDLFMRLATERVFLARWTNDIHDEWIRNVLKQRPELTREQLERTRALMDVHAEGSLVEGYEDLIPTLSLSDSDDRHVLAAAITAGAGMIVTFNLTDFPVKALEKHGIRPMHPEVFLSELFESTPEAFLVALRIHRAALKNPAKTAEEYLATLSAQGLTETIRLLTPFADQI
jgi:hypothetical protein